MLYFISIITEFLIELFLELLFSLGFRRLNDIFQHPLVTSIIFGALSGVVSLILIDEVVISDFYLRLVNLLVTPVLLGMVMSLIGKMYGKFGIQHSTMDNFMAGFSFGLAMTIVRFLFGQ